MAKTQISIATQEEHDLCLCCTNQAVDALNKKFNVRYAKGKQIEVAGAKPSNFILHSVKSNGVQEQ